MWNKKQSDSKQSNSTMNRRRRVHFAKSSICQLNVLQSMQSMNGKLCRILGPLNEQEQRYPVFVFDTKDTVLIKPCNLMRAQHKTRPVIANEDDFKNGYAANWVQRGLKFNLKDNATILYYRHFLTPSRANELHEELSHTLRWEQGRMPRLQSWMSDEGITNKMASLFQTQKGHSWTDSRALLHIKNTIEALLRCRFQYVLINKYRHNKDSVGWHCDDESIPRCKNVVASVSLGGPRTFMMRHKDWKRNSLKKEFVLASGCLLVMKDDTQVYWQHSVPKEKKRVNPRINLTFRQICSGCNLCPKRTHRT